MQAKFDFKRHDASYRARRGAFDLLTVEPAHYLMIDGAGDPNIDPAYAAALAALYPVAYKLKFASRARAGRDYTVPPLEGLWWADDMQTFTSSRDKSQWHWTMMLRLPDWLETSDVDAAVGTVRGGTDTPTRLQDLRVEVLAEGLCVQTLHVGSFDDEGPVLERMHREFMPAHDLTFAGRHHEIYLSDPRRTTPDRLRTILRQPVRRVDVD